MKLTKNFSLKEFECKCGCVMPEFVKKNVIELAENLQVLRDEVGRLDLTNAYRCKVFHSGLLPFFVFAGHSLRHKRETTRHGIAVAVLIK